MGTLVDQMYTIYWVYEEKLLYVGGRYDGVSSVAVSCAAVALWADGTVLEELLLSPCLAASFHTSSHVR